MIEIAISLAIIGFALVAIIGVLPIGMNVQKDNREQTIINQDATVWMNAIRNGVQGLDDLTNYVVAITNYVTQYDENMVRLKSWVNGYTRTNSTMSPQYPLISGYRIVGLLSTPKYVPWGALKGGSGILSNYVVAYVRSISGPASEKFPQNDPSVQDLAFCYRMTSEVVPCGTNYYDPNWTNYTAYPANTVDYVMRSNYWMTANMLAANMHDLRLSFRWPLRSRGILGQGGQSFRALVTGQLVQTNEVGYPLYPLYFFQPLTYVR